MTLDSPTQLLSTEEQEQVRQTVEMFEVITQANPQDTQSMEILKDAYARLGQQEEMFQIARRLADAYLELGQYSSALLEYESLLQCRPDDAEVIAALGEVEQRLQTAQQNAAPQSISLDFKSVVTASGNLIATKKTNTAERVPLPGAADSHAVAAKLQGADDGNEQLVRFLSQHRLVSEDIAQQTLLIVRKKNKDREENQVAASLLEEIITRGAVDPEQLLCGILDRTKFAYIPLQYYDVDRHIVQMLPPVLTLGRLMVPFDIVSRTMMIAVTNPFDSVGKDAVQQLLDYNIQWHLADPATVTKILTDAYRL